MVLVDPGKPCTERKPVKRRGVPMVKVGGMIKGGIVAIVEGEAHCALGLRGGLLGVQTQSHIGKIIISKLTYKLGGLLLLSPIGFRMEPQLGLYVRLGEMLGLGFSQLVSEPGWAQWWCGWCSLGRRYEKGGIVAIVEGEAHGALGLRGGLLGVQTQSHIGKIIISKLTYKLGGLLLLSPIGFRMEPQLGLYVRLGEMLGLGFSQLVSEPGWAQWWCGWCSLGKTENQVTNNGNLKKEVIIVNSSDDEVQSNLSVSDGDEHDSFINDGTTDYATTDDEDSDDFL
ncbi:hypothetical protein Tco_0582496 [Tanacetum coccineum]